MMPDLIEENKPLPLFRKDLKLFKGPDDFDGSPTYNLYDPTRAQYFRLSWPETTVLRLAKPGMTLKELFEAVSSQSTIKVSMEDLKNFYLDAAAKNFLVLPLRSEKFIQEYEKRTTTWLQWALYNYLYVRIPLINPDKFLSKTLFLFKPLISKPAFFLYFLISAIGLIGLADQWSDYINTFTYFFNIQGFVFYVLVVTGVKIIHEFSHAYTAKYYDIHVPTMGIALIVLWPVLYTDVTDSWKLRNRFQRLAISFAGVGAELVLAGLSTFLWILSEPGILRSVLFIVSASTWISSLLINLNPALRFDGYYLLSDLWAIDNLQPRAFALARWKLRQIFLGLDMPPPEEFSRPRMFRLVLYAIFTWIYRLILYTTIAIFVYYYFTKVLGIFLFMLEIVIFILMPFKWEYEEMVKLKHRLTWNFRLALTMSFLLLLLMWIAIPLPHTKTFTSITLPAEEQILHVPYPSKVENIYAKRGDSVQKGQLLLNLTSQELNHAIDENKTDIAILEKQILLNTLLEKNPEFNPTFLDKTNNELASKEAKLKALIEQKHQLDIKAEISGYIYSWNENLKPGQYLKQNDIVGKIAKQNAAKVLAFIPENDLHYVEIGKKVQFRLKNSNDYVNGVVVKVEPARVAILKYPVLASSYHGDLPVVQTGVDVSKTHGFNIPSPSLLGTYYVVSIDLDLGQPDFQYENTGYTRIKGPPESWLFDFISNLKRLFLRESNF